MFKFSGVNGPRSKSCFPFFPQTVWPHWGVLTVSVKVQCSFEVVSVASGIFPAHFRTEWLLRNVHVNLDCTGSHKTGVAAEAYAIFLVNFHKMAAVKCPCAFRLRRFARSGGGGRGVRHFHSNFCTKWLFDCAGAHETWPRPGCSACFL